MVSSSSSSLGIFDDVWPYPRYDAQGTANVPLNMPGYDLRGSIIPLQYGGKNYYSVCPILIEYSETMGFEVIYVMAYGTHGETRLFALSPDGSQLWVTVSLGNSTLANIILSNNEKHIYCSVSTSVAGIKIEDGSVTWSRSVSSSDIYGITDIIDNGNGSLFFCRVRNTTGVYRTSLDTYKIKSSDGSIVSQVNDVIYAYNVPQDGVLYRKIIADSTKLYLYCCLSYTGQTRLAKIKTDNVPTTTTIIPVTLSGGTEAKISCNGLAYKNGFVYMTSNFGLFKLDDTGPTWRVSQSLVYPTEPAISDDETIYYRDQSTIYAINSDSSSKWTQSGFQSSDTNNVSIIIGQDGNIITASSNTSGNNFTILLSANGSTIDDQSLYNSPTRFIDRTPSLGSLTYNESNNAYISYYDTAGAALGYIFIFYDSGGNSSSSSSLGVSESSESSKSLSSESSKSLSSQSSPSSRSLSESTQSLESESTISQSETSETSELSIVISPALSIVQTTYYVLTDSGFVSVGTSDASNNGGTNNTVFAKSPTFGNISPGQTSSTVVMSLSVPNAIAINNIKLGLINAGGITFADEVFGITTSSELRTDIEPDAYFQGVNSSGDIDSPYNIPIPNKDAHSSVYVYLNTKLQSNKPIGTGLVKFQWFFGYAD